MDRDAAEHWLDEHDPERRPKPATGIILEPPIEGAPAHNVKIDEPR